MKIILGSRIHPYLKRLSIFLIIVALIVGMAGCEASSCGAPSLYQYVLSIFSTVGGGTTPGGEVTFTYDEGAVVNLAATPDAGYQFVKWTGDVNTVADVYAAETTITINDDYSITANFAAAYELAISSTEGGDVTTPGEGIFTYDGGTVVDLVAAPDPGYQFVNWTGDVDTIADVYAASTTITMNGDYSITAEFAWQYELTISSTEGGDVTEPGEGVFPRGEGSVVNLVAEPEEGYLFVEWTGNVGTIADADVYAASTNITINGDYSITANFEQIPPEQFTLTISSTAGGSVTTPGDGTFAYDEGAIVNLAAEADEGYQFLNWTGDVSTIPAVNATTTTITMNGDYSITANFVAVYELTISSTDGGEVITPGEGTFTYDAGTVVDLVATPDAYYGFAEWTGNVSFDVNAATTTITMNDHYSITANFALPIWDWYDLDAIRDNLGGSYILMNDLDSTTAGYTELASETSNGGKGWQPIGTTAKNAKFAGSFDGQGHELCDLFIDRPAKFNVGLFGVVGWGGVIENVSLMNVTVTAYSGVGGLVGWNRGTVSNSYSTGRVTGGWRVGGLVGHNSGTVSNSYSTGRVSGGWRVGGLVGHNSGTVSTSYSSGNVTGGWNVGGLAGYNSGNVSNSYSTGRVTGGWWVGGLAGYNSGTVTDSYSTGSVTGYGSVGGLVGWNKDTVTDSYSSGSVTGNRNVGGLVGWNEDTVTDSYSTGSVAGNKRVGGLVGYNIGTVSNSFWDTQTSGQATSDGGNGKTTAEMQDIATFTGAAWDITDVDPGETNPAYTWNIVDDVTYPFLSWESV